MIDRRAFLGALAAAVGVPTSAKRGFLAPFYGKDRDFGLSSAETAAMEELSAQCARHFGPISIDEACRRMAEALESELRRDFYLLRSAEIERERVLRAMWPEMKKQLGPSRARLLQEELRDA